MKKSKPIILIAGPTACGKSALAADLAQHYNGCIINADSMQLYKDLQVLTARPPSKNFLNAPYKLYGILKGDARFSAARWREMTLQEINWAKQKHLQPIIVGGTGLYFQALLQGLSSVPAIPEIIQYQVLEELDNKGLEFLYASLSHEDPRMAQKLHPHDRHRIIRALSVIRATGKSLSQWHEEDKGIKAEYDFLKILILPERELLYQIADDRFDTMIAQGALEEVQELMHKDYPSFAPVFKALGVSQLRDHLNHRLSLDEAISLAKIATRQYIKRQYTWFRGQFEADFVLSFPYGQEWRTPITEFIDKNQ